MYSASSIRIALAAAVLACAAAPALAQAPGGPLRDAALDASRLPTGAALAPATGGAAAFAAPAIDVSGAFALRVPASKPHVYQSAPLSALLGVAGGVLGLGAGLVLLDCSDEGTHCGQGFDNAEYFTTAAGLALGAATGAHFGGRRRDSRGSWGMALLGAAVGALPMVFVSSEGEGGTAQWVSLATAPAGAVLADYLVRKPRG
jgi:hypothetical protein